MGHAVTTRTDLISRTSQATCECGVKSPKVPHRWMAEDWHAEHLNRIRSAGASRNPRLGTVLKQYRKAEVDPLYTPAQQALWKQMADEIEARIASKEGKGGEQLTLF